MYTRTRETERVNSGYHDCPNCGKTKFVGCPGEWGYKRIVVDGKSTTIGFFCSWSCYRKWEKEHPLKKTRIYDRGDRNA